MCLIQYSMSLREFCRKRAFISRMRFVAKQANVSVSPRSGTRLKEALVRYHVMRKSYIIWSISALIFFVFRSRLELHIIFLKSIWSNSFFILTISAQWIESSKLERTTSQRSWRRTSFKPCPIDVRSMPWKILRQNTIRDLSAGFGLPDKHFIRVCWKNQKRRKFCLPWKFIVVSTTHTTTAYFERNLPKSSTSHVGNSQWNGHKNRQSTFVGKQLRRCDRCWYF